MGRKRAQKTVTTAFFGGDDVVPTQQEEDTQSPRKETTAEKLKEPLHTSTPELQVVKTTFASKMILVLDGDSWVVRDEARRSDPVRSDDVVQGQVKGDATQMDIGEKTGEADTLTKETDAANKLTS